MQINIIVRLHATNCNQCFAGCCQAASCVNYTKHRVLFVQYGTLPATPLWCIVLCRLVVTALRQLTCKTQSSVFLYLEQTQNLFHVHKKSGTLEISVGNTLSITSLTKCQPLPGTSRVLSRKFLLGGKL